jgi:hypothetical protein
MRKIVVEMDSRVSHVMEIPWPAQKADWTVTAEVEQKALTEAARA